MLKNKTAIVTGAARGIGFAIARRFVADGARVVIADVDAAGGVAAAASIGGEDVVRFVACDVGAGAEVAALVDFAIGAFGPIDVLVNNAGILVAGEFLDLKEEDFDRVLRVNLKGAFLCSQAVARHMVERVKAGEALGRAFGVSPGHTLFHSVVVHFENDQPIQVEDRHVNPEVAPDYLTQDFTSQTPNAYLMRVAPLQGVSFEIEALHPPQAVAEMLAMQAGEPCLVLRRQTRSMGKVASVAAMWHPASRYQFTGSF